MLDSFRRRVGDRAVMRGKKTRISVLTVVMAGLVVSGCVTTSFQNIKTLAHKDAGPRILLMPTDIELSELNAGGITEPNAEWTAIAKKLVKEALRNKLAKQSAILAIRELDEGAFRLESPEIQLVKLHGAVGAAIVIHKFRPELALPTKADTFDWSLGPDAKFLGQTYDADYALFVFIRDSYTSPGRAVAILLMAALGVGIQGGRQVGYASLVDLRTGEIVWFNLLMRAAGDLRKPEPAMESVNILLENFPK